MTLEGEMISRRGHVYKIVNDRLEEVQLLRGI